MTNGSHASVLLVDSNVLFIRRITEALRSEGLEVVHCSDPAYALTTIEWNAPAIILCAVEFREMGAFEMVSLLRGDAKTASIPLMALGNGAGHGQMQAYRSGCDDYIDRRRSPSEIASHVRAFLTSLHLGFHPTQLLPAADTSLSGSLAHLDLPGVLQLLGQAGQTGTLHINAGSTDAIIIFEEGVLKHAEYARLEGDEAVIEIVKDCHREGRGEYKFVPGPAVHGSTVRRSTTDLLLDAMREYDEASRDAAERETS